MVSVLVLLTWMAFSVDGCPDFSCLPRFAGYLKYGCFTNHLLIQRRLRNEAGF
jgi:hypothetical protein